MSPTPSRYGVVIGVASTGLALCLLTSGLLSGRTTPALLGAALLLLGVALIGQWARHWGHGSSAVSQQLLEIQSNLRAVSAELEARRKGTSGTGTEPSSQRLESLIRDQFARDDGQRLKLFESLSRLESRLSEVEITLHHQASATEAATRQGITTLQSHLADAVAAMTTDRTVTPAHPDSSTAHALNESMIRHLADFERRTQGMLDQSGISDIAIRVEKSVEKLGKQITGFTDLVGRTHSDTQHGIGQLLDFYRTEFMRAEDLQRSALEAMHSIREGIDAVSADLETQKWGLDTQRSVYLTAVDSIVAFSKLLSERADGLQEGNEQLRQWLDHRIQGLSSSVENLSADRSPLERVESKLAEVVAARNAGVALLRKRIDELDEKIADASKKKDQSDENLLGALMATGDEIRKDREKIDDRLKSHINTMLKAPNFRERCEIVNEIRAMEEVSSRYALRAPAPRLTPSSMEARSLELVTLLVEQHRPNLVLECGSGVSSVWLSYALEKFGGRLVSLDHLKRFGDDTRLNLEEHGLKDTAEVRFAPLEQFQIGGEDFQWYGSDGWSSLKKIDMLIVDGPPTQVGPMARFPALPLLAKQLSDGAIIIVDDAARDDETKMIAKWSEMFPNLSAIPHSNERIVMFKWSTPPPTSRSQRNRTKKD